jgi:hypothetical protein
MWRARITVSYDTSTQQIRCEEYPMIHTFPLLLGFVAAALTQVAPAPPAQKIEVISVVGCLKQEAPNEWRLANATDPAPSRAGTPSPDEVPKEPAVGKNQYKLIGVSEFPLNDKKDKTVYVRGMYIKASPLNRINITSVTTVAATCPAAK